MVLLLMFSSVRTNAFTHADKIVKKARAAVQKAAPDDWETYAKAAQMCINKDVNLAEAKEWLNKSLEIKDNALANEVAGDYYASNKLYKKAVDHYVKSMKQLKENNFYADTAEIQKKIDKANRKI